jgi:hypothetical protein
MSSPLRRGGPHALSVAHRINSDVSIGRPPRSIPALYMFILDNLNSGDGQLALATLTNAAQIRRIDQDVVHCRRRRFVSPRHSLMIFCSRSHALSHASKPPCRPQARQAGKRVARVKRSETRGSRSIVPGLRFASPGLRADPPRKAWIHREAPRAARASKGDALCTSAANLRGSLSLAPG